MTGVEVRAYFGQASARWSLHAAEEATADRLLRADVEKAIAETAEVIERYPDTGRGRAVLTLAWLTGEDPVHAVLEYNRDPWVVVTVCRPSSEEWLPDFRTRRARP